MARPPLPLGQHGRIKRTELEPGTWVAKARYRDLDGITRLVERRTPAGKVDRYGAAAERELVDAIGERTAPAADDITGETRISVLWSVYRGHLEHDGKALRTLDRYDYVASKITTGLGGIRIREATTQRLDGFIRTLSERTGPSVAKTAKVLLSGMFKLAVRFGAAANNPVRDVSSITTRSKAARSLTTDDLQAILRGMAMSTKPLPALTASRRTTSRITVRDYCAEADLVDVVVMFAATGCRISEVLGLRWSDLDVTAKTLTVSGKVIRAKGRGLIRENTTKSEAGQRVLPLPAFAVAMLLGRQVAAGTNPHNVIFPSQVGTLRDPDNCSKQWRRVRDALGFSWVTTHTFRKTLATIIDSEGMSARVGADHLGHRQVSMTQNVYMGRGQVHGEVAAALDRAVGSSSSPDQ